MATARADQRRQHILDIARALFLSQGYEQTSLDQVVAEAGGSKQTIYRYFGSKKGLFEAVVAPVIEASELSYPLDKADIEHHAAALKAFSHSYLKMLLSPDALSLSRAVIAHSLIDKQAAKMFLAQGPVRYYRKLAAYLDRLVAAKKITADNTELVAQQLLATLRGHIHQQAIFDADYRPGKEVIEVAVDTAIAAFIRSYNYN